MPRSHAPDPAPLDSPPIDTTPLFDGRFVPFRRLGTGSQGETFEAVDRLTGRAVALKRFDVQGAHSWKDVELAEREAIVLRTLNHEALPAYVMHFEHAGALYLAMEKVDGKNLSAAVAEGKRFTFEELLRLLETLANVFEYLHGRQPPVVHRDIKPSNVILRDNGQFALIDFGSVRHGLLPQGGSTVVGTFGYMAPEQFQGRAMPASDLYGTGVTLLTLLTGTSPENLPHRGLELDVRAALPRTTPEPWLTTIEGLTRLDPDVRGNSLAHFLPALRDHTTTRPTPNSNASSKGNVPEPDPRTVDVLPDVPLALPFPFYVLVRILRIVLYVGLVVLLPLILTLLSIVLGRSLRTAARDVASAGERALRELDRFAQSPEPRKRSRQNPPSGDPEARKKRMRVGNFDVEVTDESNHAEDSEPERRRRRR